MEIELPVDFKEFLSLLHAHGVEYLLIGGYAVGYHGYPRATEDLDIWIATTPENARRVMSSLKDFGFNTPSLTWPALEVQVNSKHPRTLNLS